MPDIQPDVIIALDDTDITALMNARNKQREQLIRANDANRKLLRAAETSGAESTFAKAAETEKSTAVVTAATFKAEYDSALTASKTKNSFTDKVDEELFDLSQGTLIMRPVSHPKASGEPWPEIKRIKLTDKQCDDSVAAYIALNTANDEAVNILRKISAYEKANPKNGSLEEESDFDAPELAAMKADLNNKLQIVKTSQELLGEIIGGALASETDYDGMRHNIETGEIILVKKPAPKVEDKIDTPIENIIP